MLYRLHNNIFIIGLLILGFLTVLSAKRACCIITPYMFFAFITQVVLLIWFAREENAKYSEKELFLSVLIYSIFLGGLLIVISYFSFEGEKFLFEDPDGLFYYQEGLRSYDIGLIDNAKRIVTRFGFDDWGALLFSAFMMSIIPSFYFMYAFYFFIGALTAVLLFRIGKHVMPEQYSFLAALAYGTSSFMMMFHCTYLKESFFVFLVVCAVYFFYLSISEGKNGALLVSAIFLFVIATYRPAVVLFLVVAFIAYYAVTQRGNAISIFLYGIIAVAFVVSIAFLQSQVDHYTEGGNSDELLAENGSANYSGGFNYFVGWFSAFFGPFPTLFPSESMGPRNMNFYGAGLTYKLFLVIPLWTGVFYSLKRFDVMTIPLLAFVLVEMLATGYIMASFELRKVLLHVPFTYTLSFYGLYQLENNKVSKSYIRLSELAGVALTIGILFLWNVIKVKG